MKKIKILVITIAVLFAVVYTLNLEYFVKGIRIVYLNGESTVFIDDLKYFEYETIKSPKENHHGKKVKARQLIFPQNSRIIIKKWELLRMLLFKMTQSLERNIMKIIL